MKVIPVEEFERIRQERAAAPESGSRHLEEMIFLRYDPSHKVTRNPKKKMILSKIITDFRLKDKEKEGGSIETVIMKSLNKLSPSNVEDIAKELSSIAITDAVQIQRYASIVLRKALCDTNWISTYIDLMMQLAWNVPTEDKNYLVRGIDAFILEMQALFEKDEFDKVEGKAIITALGHLFTKGVIRRVVVEGVIHRLLEGSNTDKIEIVIAFLRMCEEYEGRAAIVSRILGVPGLPSRIRFLIT